MEEVGASAGRGPVAPAIAEDGTDGTPPMAGGRPGSSLLMFPLCVKWEAGSCCLKGREGSGKGLT